MSSKKSMSTSSIADCISSHCLQYAHTILFLGHLIIIQFVIVDGPTISGIAVAIACQALTMIFMSIGIETKAIKHVNMMHGLRHHYLLFAFIQGCAMISFYYSIKYTSLLSVVVIFCTFPIYINAFWFFVEKPTIYHLPIKTWFVRLFRLVVFCSVLLVLIGNPSNDILGITLAFASAAFFCFGHFLMISCQYRVYGSDFIYFGATFSIPMMVLFMILMGNVVMLRHIGLLLISCAFRALATCIDVFLVQNFSVSRGTTPFRFVIVVIIVLFLSTTHEYEHIPPHSIIGLVILGVSYLVYTIVSIRNVTKEVLLYSIDIYCPIRLTGLFEQSGVMTVIYDYTHTTTTDTLAPYHMNLIVDPEIEITSLINDLESETKILPDSLNDIEGKFTVE